MGRKQNVNKNSRTGDGRPLISFISPQPHASKRGNSIDPNVLPFFTRQFKTTTEPRRSRERATLIAVKFKQQALRQRRKARVCGIKRLILSKNYCRRLKSAMMVSTKLHPGVNFWIQATLCDSHRLEDHPSLRFVNLSGPQPSMKKPMALRRSSQDAQDYLFICLPANTTISSTRRFISSTTFSNTRLRDSEING